MLMSHLMSYSVMPRYYSSDWKDSFELDPTKLTNVSRETTTCLWLRNQGRWWRRRRLGHCLSRLRALDLGLQGEVEEGDALWE